MVCVGSNGACIVENNEVSDDDADDVGDWLVSVVWTPKKLSIICVYKNAILT